MSLLQQQESQVQGLTTDSAHNFYTLMRAVQSIIAANLP